MKEELKNKVIMSVCVLAFGVLMSVPFLVPGCGFVALVGFVPLFIMERLASQTNVRRVWVWYYIAFLLWNLFTTFWVSNATLGGGIFAVLANSFLMSVIFGFFRLSKKAFGGVLPYIFFMVTWLAWEHLYFSAEISWPWLTLGNAFARTVSLAQWYEFTGTLGGSLWILATNLSLFGLMCILSDGTWNELNNKARVAVPVSILSLIILPIVVSVVIYNSYKETDNPLEVLIIQPNIDPYNKFERLTQSQQNDILVSQVDSALAYRKGDSTASPLLIVAPETFTNDVVLKDFDNSSSLETFDSMLKRYPNTDLLFGASTYEFSFSELPPSPNARPFEDDGLWVETHNSALLMDSKRNIDVFHKSKLVVGVEMTPYPEFFTKIDDMLGGVMGRNIGQEEISVLNARFGSKTIPIGSPICYESVFGEYCTGYVKKGAQALSVITNDAWWGNTPGYVQHLSYSSLRAIETRRDVARSANTGISAIINQRGDIVAKTSWWKKEVLAGKINLNDKVTFFVKQGDIVGRISVFVSCLMFLLVFVRLIITKKRA